MTSVGNWRGRIFIGLFIGISVLSVFYFRSFERKPEPKVRIKGQIFGTTYNIDWRGSCFDVKGTQKKIDEVLQQVDIQFSTYKSESKISQINTSLDAVKIDEEFAQLMKLSGEVYLHSEGWFNPAIGPLVNFYGFGPQEKESVGDIEELKRASRWDRFLFSPIEVTVKRLDENAYLDLSAIAKGHAVDRVFDLLQAQGCAPFFIEIGGEVRSQGVGLGDEKIWRLGVEKPDFLPGGVHPPYKVIEFRSGAFATSGNTRNYVEKNGQILSHIFDPRLQKPAFNNLLSVTLYDESSCARADAWATALFAMGLEEAKTKALKYNLSAFLIFQAEGEGGLQSWSSPAFLQNEALGFLGVLSSPLPDRGDQ